MTLFPPLLPGSVIQVDDQRIVLESKVLGKVTLPRKEVQEIQLGSRPSRATPSAPKVGPPSRTRGREAQRRSTDRTGSRTGQGPAGRISDAHLVKELRSRGLDIKSLAELKNLMPDITLPNDHAHQTPEDVVRQLRTEGVDPTALDDLRSQVPLMAIPGVRSYFDGTLQGLISGRLDLHDIRQDAVKARDGLLDLKKDLGPSGDALDGYLLILEGFINQTANATTVGPVGPTGP